MKILISEDNIDKANALSLLLRQNFNSLEIDYAKALNSSFKKIKNNLYDIVLLDMTMPTYENQDDGNDDFDSGLRTLAGKDLLIKLNYRNICVPVIIVTAFEVFGRHDNLEHINNIASDLMQQYPSLVIGFVLYDVQSDNWKNKLIEIIKKVEK